MEEQSGEEEQIWVEEQRPSLEETLHTARRRMKVRAPAVGPVDLHTCRHHQNTSTHRHNTFIRHHNICSHHHNTWTHQHSTCRLNHNTSTHHHTCWSHHTQVDFQAKPGGIRPLTEPSLPGRPEPQLGLSGYGQGEARHPGQNRLSLRHSAQPAL